VPALAPEAKAGASKAKAREVDVSLKGNAALSVGKAVRVSKGHFAVPLMIKVQKGQVFSSELALDYAPNAFEAVAVNTGPWAKDALIVLNLEEPGKITIGLASASPLKGSGELISVVLKQKRQKAAAPRVPIREARFNDGRLKVVVAPKDRVVEERLQDESEPFQAGTVPIVEALPAASEAPAREADPPKATLSIASPAAGEKWAAGSTQTIVWTHADDPESLVNIELLKGGLQVATLAFQVPLGSEGKGSYQWAVPAALAP
jgi:hypothetical protein